MNEKKLLIGLSYIDRKFIEESEKELSLGRTGLLRRRAWLIAAAIAMTLLLVGCAVAAYARIHMRVVLHNPSMAAAAGEQGPSMQSTEPTVDLLSCCYPQSLPAGYRMESGPRGDYTARTITYRNDAGGMIAFAISITQPMDISLAPPVQQRDLTVSGCDALLQVAQQGAQAMTWYNPEGYHAAIYTEDSAVDLVALAESVAPGEPLETAFHDLGPDYVIELDQEKTAYVGWEPIYPLWVPEGFTVSFVSEAAYGQQVIDYKNDGGEFISYTLYYRLGEDGAHFDGMGQPEEVSINGKTGYLSGNKLIWTDEARGLGFSLTSSPGIDLIPIAQNVGLGSELEPTYGDWTQKALEELGDYQITALPETMKEDSLSGAPLEEGGGWYSYIRRWYVDLNTNEEIYFTYETYFTGEDGEISSLEEAARLLIGSEDAQIHRICGYTGAVLQEGDDAKVLWLVGDETRGVSFTLYSTDFSQEELLEMAQSVQKK